MKKTREPENNQEPIAIETAKVIRGMSLVFSGAVKMLEALHPHVSLAPSAILSLVTGDMEGIATATEAKKAQEDQQAEADIPVVEEPVAEEPEKPAEPEAENKAEPEQVTPAAPAATTTLTADDIAKVIVQKIKRDRTVREKIEPLLKTYGVARVSELPPEKIEAFMTDISQI
ncbi:MAG: hypothetical protein J5825_06910 [Lachnospiraceae bacterium]|nr:hypothetical protein [Lachnospiraceae bacterium]